MVVANYEYVLNNLVDWCETNGMEFNPNKCKIMTYPRSRNTNNSDYMIGCHSLESSSVFKDLGVTLNTSLQFSHHLDNDINEAFQILGFILTLKSSSVILKVFKSLSFPCLNPY